MVGSNDSSFEEWKESRSCSFLGCASTDFKDGRRKSGVYCILNFVGLKMYVGSAKNLATRWSVHKSELNRNKHHAPRLQNAWNKYGSPYFRFIILAYCSEDELRQLEQTYIDSLRPVYNVIKKVGQGPNPGMSLIAGREHGRPAGWKHTDEAKAKMRRPRPSIAGENNPWYGKGLKGKDSPFWGRKRPYMAEFNRRSKGRRVEQFTLEGVPVAVFPSTREAAKSIGLKWNGGIAACARGIQQKAHGYIWKYLDET